MSMSGDSLRRGVLMMAIVVTGWALTGCGDAASTLGFNNSAAALQTNVYRLKPGDKLKIAVFNEPDLTGEFQVGDGGKIAFPLVGEVQAAGLSVNDFQSGLARQLQQGFVRNPRVTVDFINYRPINVIGEVRNAGQYAYRPGLTIQDAIAMAGGYTYRANTRTVYVRRSDDSKDISVSVGGSQLTILPGDNIRVPERYF
jgi:polysaccharide export outer membrane protein